MRLEFARRGSHWAAAISCLLLAAAFQAVAVVPYTVSSAKGKLAAGNGHSLQVQPDGTLRAWGDNTSGQLGDGTSTNRSAPVAVLGISNVASVAGGGSHSLALKADATLWAWGNNASGQVGDGTNTTRGIPVAVKSLSGVAGIAAGRRHSLALRSDGTVWAWGDNYCAQLGDNTTTSRTLPVQVLGLSGITAVSGGDYHSLALRSDGTVWAWGCNWYGQIGNNTTNFSPLVAQVAGLSGVTAIAARGNYSLALRSDGTVWSWGRNESGQLGAGSSQDYSQVAVRVGTLSGIVAIAATPTHGIAVRSDGTVWVWGYNGDGELGNGTQTNSNTPVMAIGLAGAVVAAGGEWHTLAMTSDGKAWAWGWGGVGQLGEGSVAFITPPIPVAPLPQMSAGVTLAGGSYHSLGIDTDGKVYAWGSNVYGQLGIGSTISQYTPTLVSSLTNAIGISGGSFHSLALRSDGSVWSWGSNFNGRLGDGTTVDHAAPVQAVGLFGMKAVAAGGYHSLALKADGTVWGWGYNSSGQVGDLTTTDQPRPVKVAALSGVQAIAAGQSHSLALNANGTVSAWGYNADGELGDNATASHGAPTVVLGLGGVKMIAAGSLHSMALKQDGTVWIWGFGLNGELGTGAEQNSPVPVQVPGLTGIQSVAARDNTNFALKNDGTLWAWGRYIGLRAKQISPAYFPIPANGVIPLGAGGQHALMADANGRIWAVGNNTNGQLGLGYASNGQLTPVRVYDASAAALNSVPVVEFVNPNIGAGHYFMTSDPIEAVAVDQGAAGPGWVRSGRGFRAWRDGASAPPGAQPVCRFYTAISNSHFFTPFADECAQLKAINPTNNAALGWRFESIDFYAVIPTAGACPAGYQMVYREYNNRALQADSNHRVNTSYIDNYRAITFLGYVDEKAGYLCSPVASIAGGDVQAYYLYPGTQGKSGDTLTVYYVFANNGPGSADGARGAIILSPGVTDWSGTYAATSGVTLNANVSMSDLVNGFTIPTFPAGGVLVFTITGTAPPVNGAQAAEIRWGNTILPPDKAPDVFNDNNLTAVSSTFIKNAIVCSYGVPTPQMAFAASGGTSQMTVATNNGCAVATGSNAPWLAASATGAQVSVTAQANVGGTPRSGTVTVAGQTLTVNQAAAVVNTNCVTQLQPTSAIVAYNATPGVMGLSTAGNDCAWSAQTNAPWISILSSASGIGGGAVTYRVEANTERVIRIASITVNNKEFTVVQHPVEDASGDGSGPGSSGDGGGGDGGGDGGAGSGSGGDGGGDG